MSARSNNATHLTTDQQLQNFLTLKAKVIHTDELIRRYKEKSQECDSLQGQLRETLNQQVALEQGMVGLRAEVHSLVEEAGRLKELVAAHHAERNLLEARAINAELLVQQLTARVEEVNSTNEERDSLAKQCDQLKDQLKKALNWPLSGRYKRHHSFTSLSLPTSPPLSTTSSMNGPPSLTAFSLPDDLTFHSKATAQGSMGSEFIEDMESAASQGQAGSEVKMSDLDSSTSDSSGDDEQGVAMGVVSCEGDDSVSELSPNLSPSASPVSSHISPLPSSLPPSPLTSPLPSPLVQAAADTMNSDSETDMSLSEVESLSPIPPSPQPRLPTLSPLPLSPAGQTLSPLPSSPLPPPHTTSSTLPQFVSSAPHSCHAPVPSVSMATSPPPIISPSHAQPTSLPRSQPSLFSPTTSSLTIHTPLEPLSPPSTHSPPPPSTHSPPPSSTHSPLPPSTHSLPPPSPLPPSTHSQLPPSTHSPPPPSTHSPLPPSTHSPPPPSTHSPPPPSTHSLPQPSTHSLPPPSTHSPPSPSTHSLPQTSTHSPPSPSTHSLPQTSTHSPPQPSTHSPPPPSTHSPPPPSTHSLPPPSTHSPPPPSTHSLPQPSTHSPPPPSTQPEVLVAPLADVSQVTERKRSERGCLGTGKGLSDVSEDRAEPYVARRCEETGSEVRTTPSSEIEDGEITSPANSENSDCNIRVETEQIIGDSGVKRRLLGPPPTKTARLADKREEEREGEREGERECAGEAEISSGVEEETVSMESNTTLSVETAAVMDQARSEGVGYSAGQPLPGREAGGRRVSLPGSGGERHVLLTDRATGQVEESTPLSSPANSLPSLGATTVPSLGEILAQPPQQASLQQASHPLATSSSQAPSMLQQSLCRDLACPLTLPDWLVATMARVQGLTAHNPQPSLRKKKLAPWAQRRHPKQKPRAYVLGLIERMMTGQLPLSALISKLTDSWNCPNTSAIAHTLLKYMQSSYSPRIEHVVATYNSLCGDASSNALLSPLSPSFPAALLRPECQLVALLHHTAQLNTSTPTLLSEVAASLSSAALNSALSFHRLAAIARVFTAVCRLLGDHERVLFLSCDLLRKPLTSAELPVITGMAGVWPVVFARRREVGVVSSGRLHPAGVEAQPLSYTVEVVVAVQMRQGGLSQHHITRLHTLCKWSSGHAISVKLVDKLVSVLLQLLQTSRRVTVDHITCQGWARPRPSHLTFHLVHALRLLAWFKGWVWTSDVLIKAHIWPILQAWNSKRDSVAEATVMAVVRLLGFIGQQGMASPTSSLAQLQKLLLSLLLRTETPLSIQLCAAESLLDLCPPSQPSSHEAVAVLWQWLHRLAHHPAGPHLSREFCPKLSSAPPPTPLPPSPSQATPSQAKGSSPQTTSFNPPTTSTTRDSAASQEPQSQQNTH